MGIKRVKRSVNGRRIDVWIFDLYIGGRRIRTPRNSYFPTKDECETAAASIKADFRRGLYQFPSDSPRISARMAADYYLQKLADNRCSKRHRLRAEHSLERLFKIFDAERPVIELAAKHLEDYARARAREVKPQTLPGDFLHLIGFLKLARKDFVELRSWQIPAKPAWVKKARGGRTRLISEDEEARILTELRSSAGKGRHAIARRECADIFQTAMSTAMRIGEILALKWTDVYLETSLGFRFGWLIVRATKTARSLNKQEDERIVPVTESLAELLKRRLTTASSEYVFPAIGTMSAEGSHRTSIYQVFAGACERARIPHGRDTAGGLVFHDTRHTVITRLLQDGHDIKTVMDLAGHRDVTTTLIYTHSTIASKMRAIESLDKRRVHLESTADPRDTKKQTGSQG